MNKEIKCGFCKSKIIDVIATVDYKFFYFECDNCIFRQLKKSIFSGIIYNNISDIFLSVILKIYDKYYLINLEENIFDIKNFSLIGENSSSIIKFKSELNTNLDNPNLISDIRELTKKYLKLQNFS